ncbi:hypothetical protein [Gemmatirosa kalamazoonensis]|uniref:hypothetical protein n=1 Tax=Gemmatirosa kalamazoonensis TaxID=861299 RepID=UPI0004B159A6|nr:hypothetical protein [Gemmatirosa kalamazoonensis]
MSLRAGAITDRTMLRVTTDTAVKRNVFPSSSGHSSGRSNLQTRLHVEAWVRNASYVKHVWIDVHVLAMDDAVLQRETFTLGFTHAAGDGNDVFAFDGLLYQGSVATQGSVDPRPDARTVQYRLYCEQTARIFTDGTTHECELREDARSG